MREPPPRSDGSLDYVLWIVEQRLGFSGASEYSVIGDDFDLDDKGLQLFVACLEDRFGQLVLTWPWGRIVPKRRTLTTKWLTVPVIGWLFALWLTWHDADGRDALVEYSLGHIAKVIDHGEWIEP